MPGAGSSLDSIEGLQSNCGFNAILAVTHLAQVYVWKAGEIPQDSRLDQFRDNIAYSTPINLE